MNPSPPLVSPDDWDGGRAHMRADACAARQGRPSRSRAARVKTGCVVCLVGLRRRQTRQAATAGSIVRACGAFEFVSLSRFIPVTFARGVSLHVTPTGDHTDGGT